jgi:plastocyanin
METMNYRNRLLSVLILAVILASAAGCAPPSIQTASSLTVQITEKGFTPAEVYVPAGQEITIQVTNKTDSDHIWIILAEPYFSPYQADAPDVYYQITIPAGESITDTFTAPTTGIQLDIICENELCIEAGFRGRFIAVDE